MSSDAAERFRAVAARSGVDVVLLDPALLEHAKVWAAAGTLSSVFPLSHDRLTAVSGARVVDVPEAVAP